MDKPNLIRAQGAFDRRMNVAIVVCLVGAGLAVTDERSFLPLYQAQYGPPKAFAVVAPPAGTGGAIGGGVVREAFPRLTRPTGVVGDSAPTGGNVGTGTPVTAGGVPQSFAAAPEASPAQLASGTGPGGGGGAGVPAAASQPGVGGGSIPATTTGGGGGGGTGTPGTGTGGGTDPGTGTGGGSVDLPPVTSVPEPATWLILVLGFGFVGCAARRSRRTLRTALGRGRLS